MRLPEFVNALQRVPSRLMPEARTRKALDFLDQCLDFVLRPQNSSGNLALDATRFPLLFGFWTISFLLLVALIWGILVPIDSATQSRGSVVLDSSRKTVQHLEGGVIDEILVKEGDSVVKGQKLIRLRDTSPNANRDQVQNELATERASLARLKAEQTGADKVSFDADMVEKSATDKALADILSTQDSLFHSERAEEDAKLDQLKERVRQSEEEIKGFDAESQSATSQHDLLATEIESVEKLLAKGYATETRLLALKRNQSELEGSKGQYEAEKAKTAQIISETQSAIINQQKDFESKIFENIHDTQSKISALQDKLRSAEDVEGRTLITAPNDGVVTGLRYHTEGGVIGPGAPILDIVPQDDDLVIEVHIKPADISRIHVGMDARVIFSSYKTRTTPRIPGKVTEVSADVFTDDHSSPPSSYYTARITVDKAFLHRLQRPIELRPGLPVDVMIRTGSRSFIGYLLKPITDSMQRAFREE